MTTDRDKSIERLLRRQLSSDRQTPGECPDAETLAALADDTLTAAARREVETHVADCHQCQALTAAMVRAESSSGATADGAAAGMPWWKGGALKWLVPATAAATAVALWVAVPGQRTPLSEEATPESQIAVAPPAAAPEAPGSDRPAPAEAPRSEPVQGPADARADGAARERDAQVGFEGAAPAAPPASVPPQAPLKSEESLSSRSSVAGGLPPSLGASASAEASADKSADPAQASGRGLVAGGLQASGQAPPNEVARSESAAREQGRSLNQPAAPPAPARAAADAAGFRAAAGFDVVSPNPRIRWRVGPGPIVQYSTDGGATWAMQQTGASAELTAGSAPTPEVCWLVGRGGLVLRTTDAGRQWQRTAFPETVDLTTITASTALTASVNLADGRRFATSDGGRTWVPLR